MKTDIRKTNSHGTKTNLEGEPLHLENALWQQRAPTASRLSFISCSRGPLLWHGSKGSSRCLITCSHKSSGKGLLLTSVRYGTIYTSQHVKNTNKTGLQCGSDDNMLCGECLADFLINPTHFVGIWNADNCRLVKNFQ